MISKTCNIVRVLLLLTLLSSSIISVVHATSSEFSVPPPPPPSFWGLKSKTALVTGGTKGIGK